MIVNVVSDFLFDRYPFLQLMNPIRHLCEELIEQKSMRTANKRLADDLAAGGCAPPVVKKQKRGGGRGSAGHASSSYDDVDGWA